MKKGAVLDFVGYFKLNCALMGETKQNQRCFLPEQQTACTFKLAGMTTNILHN